MKKSIIILIAIISFVSFSKAQTIVPFAYTATIEFSKVDSVMKKTLLKYANAGKYNTAVTIKADSILQTTLVKGVKSRSGKVEDQVWMQFKEGGKIVNYLFALSSLPAIEADSAGKLKVTARRGDSD